MRFHVTMFFLIFFNILYGQSELCDFDSFELKLTLKKDSILALEPIEYTISLINISSKTRIITLPWNKLYFYPELQYRQDDNEKWKKLHGSSAGYQFVSPHGSPEFINDTLIPNEQVSISTNWLDLPIFHVDRKFRPITVKDVFSKTGKYQLRLVVLPFPYCEEAKTYSTISNTINFNILERKGIDKNAKNWLINNMPLPAVVNAYKLREGKVIAIYALKAWELHEIDLRQKLEEFIGRFPNSSFTPWAQLYLIELYYAGAKYNKQPSDDSYHLYIEKGYNTLKGMSNLNIIKTDDYFKDRYEKLYNRVKRLHRKLKRLKNN